jgi:hypothetical protein
MIKEKKDSLEELGINPLTAKFRHRVLVKNARLSVEN